MTNADWADPARSLLCAELRTASGTPHYATLETAIFCVFNSGEAAKVVTPPSKSGMRWCRCLDTSRPDIDESDEHVGNSLDCPAEAIIVLVLVAEK